MGISDAPAGTTATGVFQEEKHSITMKTYTKFSVAALSGLALAVGSVAVAQTPAFQNQTATGVSATSVTPMSSADESFSVTKLAGKPVRSANGEQPGEIGDFLIDPASGKVQFAIVPTGRGASGETYRLVPA